MLCYSKMKELNDGTTMKDSDNALHETDEQMLAVYRHDAHKMRGQSHSTAPDEWFGVAVNADVPYGADSDAAGMSRPNGEPDSQLPGHDTHYRRSIATGQTVYDEDTFSLPEKRGEIETLLTESDAHVMHQRWLASDVASGFNESVYYPYTSLKYHTLLVGALVDCYRDGLEYDDLGLWVSHDDAVEPYRTIFAFSGDSGVSPFRLVIDAHQRGQSAKLSSYPMQNFASVWNRLPKHPWESHTTMPIHWVDGQLRRMKSWSTALQYLERALLNGVGTDV